MVPGWWWIWPLLKFKSLMSIFFSFCSMRTLVQVVMSWVTWKRSGFVFLLGSMSSRTGWWSWSSNCRSPSKRYNSTGSHGKWFKFDPNKRCLRRTWNQITVTVTPLIAVSTQQSKLVQFAFNKNVFKPVDLINWVSVSADFSLVAHQWRRVRPLFQADMERALLQGERQAELDQMEAETDIIAQLQHKLDELESAIQREKDKVRRTADKPSN